jgi:hypothetical protein
MARCDEGYPCQVCGKDVENILESDLYLRYVIGQVDPELLHSTPERHIRCNPVLAQFIVADDFEPVEVDGEFGKSALDPAHVVAQEILVTRGWRRLVEVRGMPGISILQIPLAEVVADLEKRAGLDKRANS